MNAALLNERVTIQKNETVIDEVGNHKNIWTDYFLCYATISSEGLASSREKETAGLMVEDVSMTVTVRYCMKTAQITSTGYRIVFHGEVYDIVNVDHMNFKKKCLKFICRKVRR